MYRLYVILIVVLVQGLDQAHESPLKMMLVRDVGMHLLLLLLHQDYELGLHIQLEVD